MKNGIVRRVGWEEDEETGEPIFLAIVEYLNGPPSDLTFDMVWGKIPVQIVLAECSPCSNEHVHRTSDARNGTRCTTKAQDDTKSP